MKSFNNKNDDYFLRPMLPKFSCVFDKELVITAENQDRYTSTILYTYYINIRNVHFHRAINTTMYIIIYLLSLHLLVYICIYTKRT